MILSLNKSVQEKKAVIDSALKKVFIVTSWGYGADHWFSWFSKALNAHSQIFSYLANEGSRPKYFPEERSRAERPDIINYVRFIADVGMTFDAIGDCYSYRPTMLDRLLAVYPNIPILHLTRHPYAWLFFHVRWRMKSMRMLGGENQPLDHEWENGCDHDLFRTLGLKKYSKADVEIWTTYQGFWKMNDFASDVKVPIKLVPIENVVRNQNMFKELISYLTNYSVEYSASQIDEIYSWVWTPFDGEDHLRIVPNEDRENWPNWKIDAFEKLVLPEAREAIESIGYKL